jgi:hypothetical protein
MVSGPYTKMWRMPWRVEVLAKIWMLEGCRLPSLGLSLRSIGTLCSSATGFRLIKFQGRVPQSSGSAETLKIKEENARHASGQTL